MTRTKKAFDAPFVANVSSSTVASDKFRGSLDVVQIIVDNCRRSEFRHTGAVLKNLPVDYFEVSGLWEHFVTNLTNKCSTCCDAFRTVCEQKLWCLENCEGSRFLLGSITGVPGAGKSYLLKQIHKDYSLDSVCVLGNSVARASFQGLDKVFTVDEVLTADLPLKFKVLLIDEFTLVESAEILLLQRKVGASYVILFGDISQTTNNDLSCSLWLLSPIIFSKGSSRRFGAETVKFLNLQGFDCEGESSIKDTVILGDYYNCEAPEVDVLVAFTESTASDLRECGLVAQLVEDIQGKEFGRVTVFLRDEDKAIVEDNHLRLVAFSRHITLLVVRAEPLVLSLLESGELRNCKQSHPYRYGQEY
ncbi:TGBp1 [Drakaea virus A]|uniref:TGBp1 n=1 Tax=Drakaea virus A TaxID=1647805 RepID=A0A0F7KH04_9VIRU|nr:TGBp1 [Drakaea virus A]AKH39760.1 TGBp1 [Drakaea virus A]